MPINLRVDTSVITVSYVAGDSKGGSTSNPYTFNDIYLQSEASSWTPPVIKRGGMYYIPYQVLINGSTCFYSNTESIFLQYEKSDNQTFYATGSSVIVQLINSSFMTNSTPYKWFYISANASILGCYTSGFRNNWLYGISDVKPCIVDGLQMAGAQINYFNAYAKIYNSQIYSSQYNFTPTGTFTNSNVRAINGTNAVYTYVMAAGGTVTLRNLDSLNVANGIYFRPTQTNARTVELIDCNVSKSSYTILNSAKGIDIAIFKSTFNWLIDNSVNVKVTDSYGDTVLEDIVHNGSTNEITYFTRYVETSTGTTIKNDTSIYEPFTIQLSKSGYQTLTITDVSIVEGTPTYIISDLLPDISTGSGETIYVNQTIDASIISVNILGNVEINNISGSVSQTALTAQISIDE